MGHMGPPPPPSKRKEKENLRATNEDLRVLFLILKICKLFICKIDKYLLLQKEVEVK